MHRWMDSIHGMGWGGGLMMFIFWVLAILAVFFLFRLVMGRGDSPRGRSSGGTAFPGETALDILKKRYAAGEITREEYERIRKDLE